MSIQRSIRRAMAGAVSFTGPCTGTAPGAHAARPPAKVGAAAGLYPNRP